MQHLLPAAIIVSLFWVIWSVKYPRETWLALTFRIDDGFARYGMAVAAWMHLVAFVSTITYACTFLA